MNFPTEPFNVHRMEASGTRSALYHKSQCGCLFTATTENILFLEAFPVDNAAFATR